MTYTRRVCSNFSCFTILASGKQLLILLHVEIIGTRKIGTARELEGELGVVQGCQDIWNNGLLIDVDARNLTFLVDTDNAIGSFVLRSHEDGFTRGTIQYRVSSRLA